MNTANSAQIVGASTVLIQRTIIHCCCIQAVSWRDGSQNISGSCSWIMILISTASQV